MTLPPTQLPQAALAVLLEAAPRETSRVVDTLWNGDFTVAGAPPVLGRDIPLRTVLRLAAICEREDPEALATALDGAAPLAGDESDLVYVAAAQGLGRPRTMRWITANADRVAASPRWLEVLPGLGGVTKSVPLAEEALTSLMKRKLKLPRELTAFVQLNP